MTDANRRTNAALELTEARRVLRGAHALLELGLWPDAVSRAYYVAFHAVRALLYSRGLQARTHRGTRELFDEHFVRTNLVDSRHRTAFAALEQDRTAGDYGLGQNRIDASRAHIDLALASELIDEVAAVLDKDGSLQGD